MDIREVDGEAQFFLQGAPRGAEASERHLLAISRLQDPPQAEDSAPSGSRPDAAIYLPGRLLVVIEVKLDLSLDWGQLRDHAESSGIPFPEQLKTISWLEVYEWAMRHRSEGSEDSVTSFLLDQFVTYLDIVGLAPFSGIQEADFEFFAAPTLDGQQQLKAHLEGLWQEVAERLSESERTLLGEFHVGALGFEDPNAWAMSNWGEQKVNLTIEMSRHELWFNVVGWQERAPRPCWDGSKVRPPQQRFSH